MLIQKFQWRGKWLKPNTFSVPLVEATATMSHFSDPKSHPIWPSFGGDKCQRNLFESDNNIGAKSTGCNDSIVCILTDMKQKDRHTHAFDVNGHLVGQDV